MTTGSLKMSVGCWISWPFVASRIKPFLSLLSASRS